MGNAEPLHPSRSSGRDWLVPLPPSSPQSRFIISAPKSFPWPNVEPYPGVIERVMDKVDIQITQTDSIIIRGSAPNLKWKSSFPAVGSKIQSPKKRECLSSLPRDSLTSRLGHNGDLSQAPKSKNRSRRKGYLQYPAHAHVPKPKHEKPRRYFLPSDGRNNEEHGSRPWLSALPRI